MNRIFLILIYILLHFTDSGAQNFSGTVYGETGSGTKEPLVGATLHWMNTANGVVTDVDGKYTIAFPDSGEHVLIVRFTGYASDTLVLSSAPHHLDVVLKDAKMLDGIEVNADVSTTIISMLKPINVEIVGQGEIKKAACCNLSESFESNASVDVVYGDAVSGARAIQMLGLSGVYTQMQIENVPMIRGLSANFGLQYIPGTWLESIQITKGVGSVVNGFESMSGQINVEFIKPEDHKTDRLFVNAYSNLLGREELNLHFSHKFNDKVSTLLFMHGSGYFFKNDQNKDGFLDNPLSKQVNVLNRWKIQGKKTEQVFGVHAVYDDKIGGQINFDPQKDKFTFNNYGVGIRTKLIEGFFKNGFLFPSSATRSMGLIASGKHHVQDSYFGLRSYYGEQNSGYFNLIFQDIIGNTNHSYKSGLSFLYDQFKERYRDSLFNSTEVIPGAFFEYTYTYLEKFNILFGLRADHHNVHGMKYTPRVHMRYSPDEKLTFRASGGTGFRTPHIFMENMSTLASSREVLVLENLLPEESMNLGGSITRKFNFLKREAAFNVDYYYTSFRNQVIADVDFDVHQVLFYNLKGKSQSHSLQADLDLTLFKGFTLKTAYKRYVVQTTYHDTLMDRPMLPRDRFMMNMSYHTPSKKWKFDLISNYYSTSRLPTTAAMPSDMQFPERSEPYLIVHFQVTKLFRKFEWYVGGENLLNFIQQKAIMSPDDPFGPHFDASMIWGPLNGRLFYTGIRMSIKHK